MADVLIVAREATGIRVLKTSLEREGYAVMMAPSSIAALSTLYTNPHALIVLADLQESGDGTDLLKLVGADPALLGRHAFLDLSHGDVTDLRRLVSSLAAPAPATLPVDVQDIDTTIVV